MSGRGKVGSNLFEEYVSGLERKILGARFPLKNMTTNPHILFKVWISPFGGVYLF